MKTWVKITGLGLLATFISFVGVKKGIIRFPKKGMNVSSHRAMK
jgi:hypothetical protein